MLFASLCNDGISIDASYIFHEIQWRLQRLEIALLHTVCKCCVHCEFSCLHNLTSPMWLETLCTAEGQLLSNYLCCKQTANVHRIQHMQLVWINFKLNATKHPSSQSNQKNKSGKIAWVLIFANWDWVPCVPYNTRALCYYEPRRIPLRGLMFYSSIYFVISNCIASRNFKQSVCTAAKIL